MVARTPYLRGQLSLRHGTTRCRFVFMEEGNSYGKCASRCAQIDDYPTEIANDAVSDRRLTAGDPGIEHQCPVFDHVVGHHVLIELIRSLEAWPPGRLLDALRCTPRQSAQELRWSGRQRQQCEFAPCGVG